MATKVPGRRRTAAATVAWRVSLLVVALVTGDTDGAF
jgi:hypothetical protein